MRSGVDINDYPLKNSVNPHITYTMGFLEWEAATHAGLDLWKWDNGEYPKRFMAKVIAWHSLHNAVEIHSQDAANKKR